MSFAIATTTGSSIHHLRRFSLLFLLIISLLWAQVPSITSFSPATGPAGTVMTITGSGFGSNVANFKVVFGAVTAPVTTMTTTQITVTIPVGATHDFIQVVNTSQRLTGSSRTKFIPTFAPSRLALATGDFPTKLTLPAATQMWTMVAKDLDSDGKTDLIATNPNIAQAFLYPNRSTSSSLRASDFPQDGRLISTYGIWSTARIASADLTGDGKPEVITGSPGWISVYTNASTPGNMLFNGPADFAAGNEPADIAVGDLNGDGKPEIVVTNIYAATVSIFPNTHTGIGFGAGSLGTRIDLAVGSTPQGVKLADIDGNGKPEIIVVNEYGPSVSVLRNTSGGASLSFAAAVDFACSIRPQMVAISDIDGDGKLDMAVSNYEDSTVSVFRNLGLTGTVSSASFGPQVVLSGIKGPRHLDFADMDGDGKADLVVADMANQGVYLLRNTAVSGVINTSSFAPAVMLKAGFSINGLALADYNSDGKTDIATLDAASQSLSVFVNEPAYLPITSLSQTLFCSPTTAAVDVAFAPGLAMTAGNVFTAELSDSAGNFANAVVLGTLSGTSAGTISGTMPAGLAPANRYQIRVTASSPAVAGQPMTVVVGCPPQITSFLPLHGPAGTVVSVHGEHFNPVASQNAVWFGATAGTVLTASDTLLTVQVPVSATSHVIEIMDLTSGQQCASPLPFSPSQPIHFTNILTSHFSTTVDIIPVYQITQPYPQGSGMAIRDIDRDGKPDMALTYGSYDSLLIYKNISSPQTINLGVPAKKPTYPNLWGLALEHLNGDGRADLLSGSNWGTGVAVLNNVGVAGSITDSTFSQPAGLENSYTQAAPVVADFDGDGYPDVASLDYGAVQIARNTGQPGPLSMTSFSQPAYVWVTSIWNNIGLYGLAVQDFDGDGKPDLVLSGENNALFLLRNTAVPGTLNGASFAPPVTITMPGTCIYTISPADLNGDGKPDLVVPGYNNNEIFIYLNTSTPGSLSAGSFSGPTVLQSCYVSRVTVGDINGDTRPDLVVPCSQGAGFNVLCNTTPAGSSTVSFASTFIASSYPISTGTYHICDLDGDGWQEIVFQSTVGTMVQISPYRPSVTITATAGVGGSISPAGAQPAVLGSSPVYSITPNAGYCIQQVLVNGVSVGAVSSYTFSGFSTNQTISATFSAANAPTVTLAASATALCAGDSVVLTATALGGSGTPAWQWAVNGIPTGSNLPILSVLPDSGDVVTCTMGLGPLCAVAVTPPAIVLSVYQPAVVGITASICDGQTYLFGSQQLTTTGIYADTLTTVHGCDSIVTLSLNVYQPAATALVDTTCDNQPSLFGGQFLSISGIYTDTLQTINGCDSILTLTLTVFPVADTAIQAAICAGQSYLFDGQILSVAGIYTDTLQTINGCDSVITLTLTENTLPLIPIMQLIGNQLITTSADSLQWYENGLPISGATGDTLNLSHNGTYKACATNLAGCTICSADLQVLHIPPYQVFGRITTAGQAANAAVYLIAFDSTTQLLTAIDSVATDANGDYAFDSLYAGVDYRIKAALHPASAVYSGFMPTYHTAFLFWNTATLLSFTATTYGVDIDLLPGNNPGGPGFVGGNVQQGANKTAGQPLNGVLVMLLDIANNPIAYTYTDANGDYAFNNIKLRAYKVYPEVLGKATLAKIVMLTPEAPSASANFEVGSTMVTPVDKALSLPAAAISLAPNPVSQATALRITLAATAQHVRWAICNKAGQIVQTGTIGTLPAGTQAIPLDFGMLASGVYTLMLFEDNSITGNIIFSKY